MKDRPMALILNKNRNFFGPTASAAFYQQALELLPDSLCLIDPSGCILAINEAWRRFGRQNGNPDLVRSGIGANYLEVCRQSATRESAARETLIGLNAILDNQVDRFILDYTCHAPDEQRWFRLIATPLRIPFGGVVIIHNDVTDLKEALLESDEHLRHYLAMQNTLDSISRLVPICGQCGQIRTDEEIMRRLREQTDKTNGPEWRLDLCPDCRDSLCLDCRDGADGDKK